MVVAFVPILVKFMHILCTACAQYFPRRAQTVGIERTVLIAPRSGRHCWCYCLRTTGRANIWLYTFINTYDVYMYTYIYANICVAGQRNKFWSVLNQTTFWIMITLFQINWNPWNFSNIRALWYWGVLGEGGGWIGSPSCWWMLVFRCRFLQSGDFPYNLHIWKFLHTAILLYEKTFNWSCQSS